MSSLIKRKVYLTFPESKVKEPIICEMYDQCQVRFNIGSASVNEQAGLLALELESSENKIQQAIDFFRSKGITVEPIEMGLIEG